ncbi:hypothetical protein MRX96_042691 [Rhipicephalus microplus]
MWTSTVAAPLAGRRAPVKGDSPPAVSLASTAATGPPLPPLGFDRTASVPLGFFGRASTRAAVGVLATEPHRPDNAQRTAGKTFTIALYEVPDVAALDSHRPRATGRPKRFSSAMASRAPKTRRMLASHGVHRGPPRLSRGVPPHDNTRAHDDEGRRVTQATREPARPVNAQPHAPTAARIGVGESDAA